VRSTTKLQSFPTTLPPVVVPSLFAICGALSAAYLLPSRSLGGQPPMMLPIPFTFLCTLLFLHTRRAIYAVALIIAVWPIAYWVALSVAAVIGFLFPVPACLGGLIGGLGVVLSVSTCYRRLQSREYLLRGAKVGGVSALAFAPWMGWFVLSMNGPDPPQWLLICAFAIWQGAVGKYLCEICTDANRNGSTEGSDSKTVAAQ
jgi:hypothetical protein